MKAVALLLAGMSSLALATETSGTAPKGLAASDWSSIRSAYEAGRHAVHRQENGNLAARNPGQQWRTEFNGKGFTVVPDHGQWTWGLELTGYGDRTLDSASSSMTHEGGKITCPRDENLTEWFINDTRGLEQGWTIHSRDAGTTAKSENLILTLTVCGDLRPQISADGSSVSFKQESGGSALTYGGLKAWDADGQNLVVCFERSNENRVNVIVNDADARYPITIDPIAQQAYLKASNTGTGDSFGCSVAISGDIVVVGAANEDSSAKGVNGSQGNNNAIDSGAAYVFVRSGNVWVQQAYLKASNADAYDMFGSSVSISGETIVIGAPDERGGSRGIGGNQNDNTAIWSGAVYVFQRNGNLWSQQSYIKASNADSSDFFGNSVSISGDTIVVGAYHEGSAATGVNGNSNSQSAAQSGAAYVFKRTGTVWAQQAYLKASNTDAFDEFGWAVAISGNLLAVGSRQESSAASGVNGNQYDNNSMQSGAVYLFNRVGTDWTQQAYLKASNPDVQDFFGGAVAVADETVVVGAGGEDGSGGENTNGSANSGAVYVFARHEGLWRQQAYVKAANPDPNDFFGKSVGISGDVVVVGADVEDGVEGTPAANYNTDSGAAYVFARNGLNWIQQSYLKSTTYASSGLFGKSVAVSGFTVLVGCPREDSNATGVNGSYVDSMAPIADSGSSNIFTGFVPIAMPEIVVEENDQPVTNGGHKNFPTVSPGFAADLNFSVKNTGAADLTLNGLPKVGVSGADAISFTVTQEPGSLIVGPYGFTFFTVRFSPTTPGTKTATLSITNNDNDENPFQIIVTGSTPIIPTVTTPSATNVTGPNASLGGNVVSDGGAPVTVRGVVFSPTSINSDPLIGGGGVTESSATGTTGVFTVDITSLTPGISYSYKAYATNSIGTSYTTTGTFSTLSNNAELSNLVLSTGTLTPAFSSGTTSYTASVSNATTEITVTPTRAQANATITINGTSVASGTASGNIPLNVGANNIAIVVTAQNGVTTQTYTVAVIRAALLPTVTTPTSSSITGIAATLGGNVTGTGGATITERGIVLSPTSTNANPLIGGSGVTKFTGSGTTGVFTVSASGLTPATAYTYKAYATNSAGTGYTNTETFTTLSNNATLSSLVLNTATFSPVFSSGTTAYTSSVPNSTIGISVTPTRTQSSASIRVNDTSVISGNASGTIPLIVGANTINIVVTAQDGVSTQTYTVSIGRSATLPTVITPTSSIINDISAALGGNVTSDGGSNIISRGVVISQNAVNSNPVIGGVGVTNILGTGTTGVFAVIAKSLTPGMSYSFRTYAINSIGNSYTSSSVFSIPLPKPVITSSDAVSGKMNDLFSHQITASQNPTSYGAEILPSGLSVNASTGLISGTPSVYGTFAVTVTAVNSGGSGQQTLNLAIQPPFPPPVITSPLFAAATANFPFSSQLTASSSPQTYAIQSGPAWLSINATTGVLSGTPMVPANVTVQVRASNTTGPSAWSILTISISPNPNAPVVTSLAEARGRKNDLFSSQLTAVPAATSYAVTGLLPTGITLNAATGLLSGTPSVEGTFNVTVTASNSSGQSVATPLKIILGPPRLVPVISSSASFIANVASTFSSTVVATNSPTSFTFENLPTGLTQTGTTGQISGTPSTPGNFSFSGRATNSDGAGPSQTMALRVHYHPNAPNVLAYLGGSNVDSATSGFSSYLFYPNPLNFPGQGPIGPTPGGPGAIPLIPMLPPVIISPPVASAPGPSGYVGVPFFYQTLVDKPASLFTATGLPAGLTLASATGMIGGTPTASGSFEVTLQASNASGVGGPRIMTFKIDSKPDTPKITGSLNLETAALAPFAYNIQTDSILPITSYGVSGLPDGLVANFTTGRINGAATVTGTYEVKLRASSTVGAGAEQILYLRVRAVPLAPRITSLASVEVQQGASLSYQIAATNPPIQAYHTSSLPDGLSLNATTGLISGRPVVPGIHHVVLRASNANGASDPLTLQVTVKPNSAVPVMLMPTSLRFDSVNPIAIQCMATNLPAVSPWDPGIGIFAESLPLGLTLNSATGILSGNLGSTPSFTIRLYGVNNTGKGASVTIQFILTVETTQPVITGPLQLSATSGTDLSFTIATDRQASSYYFCWSGSNGTGSKYEFGPTFTVLSNDLPLPGKTLYQLGASNGVWGERNGLLLSIAPASGAPIIQSPSVIYCNAGVQISHNLAGSGNPTRFEITAISPAWPSGLIFSSTTGAFSGTVSQSGVISFLARAYNAAGASMTKEITMVFSPLSGAPAITVGSSLQLSFGLPLLLAKKEIPIAPLPMAIALTLPPLTAKAGMAFTHQFQATENVIRFAISGLPEGLVYNENTGSISGTPVNPGTFELVVTPIGEAVIGQPVQVSLVIDPADGTPVITSPGTAVAVAGTPFTWQFSTNANPTGYNIGKLPEWLVFNSFTGALSGTPTGPGDSELGVSAFNSLGQGLIQQFTIHIVAAAGTPTVVAPSANFTGRVGNSITTSVSAPGMLDFYDATALPFGISLNPQTGIFSGSPVESGTFKVNVWGVNALGLGEPVPVTFTILPAVGTPLFTGETIIRMMEGTPFSHTFSTSPSATLFAIDGMPMGWSFNSENGLLQATPIAGTNNLALEAWNAVGSSGRTPFQIRVFFGQGDLWRDEMFGEQAGNPAIADWDADPDHDGVNNLLERAFNLSPLVAGSAALVPGLGTSGLPSIGLNGTGPATMLRVEFIRRKDSGLVYTPKRSSTLAPSSFTTMTGTQIVTSIDHSWERVVIEESADSATVPTAFAIVEVALP